MAQGTLLSTLWWPKREGNFFFKGNICILMKQKWMFFLEFPCFLHGPANVENLISGSSAFFQLVHLEALGSRTAEASQLEGF